MEQWLLLLYRITVSYTHLDVYKRQVLEGLLSGSLFMLLYSVMQFLWSGQFDMNRVLVLTSIIALVFLFRILIYSYGYTKAQIGGAEAVSYTHLTAIWVRLTAWESRQKACS